MLKWMHGAQAEFEHFAPGIKAGLLEQAQECITAYEAHLRAEGFVVVRAEPTDEMLKDGAMQIAMNAQRVMTAERKAWYVYRAMLSAATTGENSD